MTLVTRWLRSLAFTSQQVRRELSSRRRQERAIARSAFTRLAGPTTRSGRQRGAVWAVGLVRNEADIINDTMTHLFDQGVDHILIADNMSTDGTLDILLQFVAHRAVTLLRDGNPGYYQSAKMTHLARLAAQGGADWIVPFDADELWFAEDGPLASHLRTSTSDIVAARIWNYLPSRDDDPETECPVLRIVKRDSLPSDFVKVAFRSHRLVEVGMGNHTVRRPGDTTQGLAIAHFSLRSRNQFIEKYRHGRRAIEATPLSPRAATHWRSFGNLSDDELGVLWERLLDGDRMVPINPRKGQLITDPIGEKICWSPLPA